MVVARHAVAALTSVLSVAAYVPALPINDTSYLDKSDASSLTILYSFPPGGYKGSVYVELTAVLTPDRTN